MKIHLPFGRDREDERARIRTEAQERANAGQHITLVSRGFEGDLFYEDLKPEYNAEIGPWYTIPGFGVKGNFLPKFTSRIERHELTSNYEDQMSDFKVGDVVRIREDRTEFAHVGQTGKLVHGGWPVRVQWPNAAGRNGDGSPRWKAGAVTEPPADCLVLVSRPSEAKPEKCLRQDLHPVSECVPPPAPAFKVGDRVRVREYPEVIGIVEQVRVHGAYPISIRCESGKYKGETDCYNALALERLYPEPATTQCGKPTWPFTYPCALAQNHGGKCLDGAQAREAEKPIDDEFAWLDNKKPKAGSIYDNAVSHKPMTATAASILARNSYEPLREQEQELAFRLIQRCTEKLYASAIGALINSSPPSNGWMPAGTYMPTTEGPKMMSQEQVKMCELISRTTRHLLFRPCSPELRPDECGSGISKRLPAYERRFSSRVATWDPMDDTFLEDE